MNVRALLNQNKILRISCACLFVCTFISPAHSQDKELSQKLEQIVRKNFQRSKKALPKVEQKIEGDVGSYIQKQKDGTRTLKGTDSAPFAPEENPLDKMGGHLDRQKSWHEYSVDSQIILNDETFPQCLEPRLIAEYDGSHKLFIDPANILTGLACEFNCHLHLPWVPPVFQTQQWKAISYYWPETQISINKSGAQMIDPDIVNENRGTKELYRQPTAVKEQSDQERGLEAQKALLEKMGITMSEFEDPEYHKAGKEPQLQQDGEVRYASSMRTNLDAQAAHKRPPYTQGWTKADTCLFNALNEKTDKKKVIQNRYDQGMYAILARYPETKMKLVPEAYKYTSPEAIKLEQYKQETPKQFLKSLCNSWLMASNPEVYGDFSKVGFTGINDPAYKTYCLPNGDELSGSMKFSESSPRLQSDAVRAVTAAIYFGNDTEKFKKINKEQLRPNWFSLYEKRATSTVPRYVGSGYKQIDINPGDNKSMVVFADKIGGVYPTRIAGSGNYDGVGGASSEGYRVHQGQRGSHCFRPEDIPNWSSEGRTTVSEWPLGLVQDVRKNFGETRWAIWNRRVLCTCEIESLPYGRGCISLNSGDKEETGFIGTQPFEGEMPPPFQKAIPVLRELADKKSPASGGNPDSKSLEVPIVDIGILGAGKSSPNMPGGKKPSPDQQGPDADAELLLICIPLEQKPQPSGQPSGQPSANASGASTDGKPPIDSNPQMQQFHNALTPEQQAAFPDYYNGLSAEQQGAFNNMSAADMYFEYTVTGGKSLVMNKEKSARKIIKEVFQDGSYILERTENSLGKKLYSYCSKSDAMKGKDIYSCDYESSNLLQARDKG